MTPEDAVRQLKPGVAIEYAPVLPGGMRTDWKWWTGVVESEPRRIGGGDSGVMVVNLCGMDPAYVWAATRNGRVVAADIGHIRLLPDRFPDEEVADLEKWRDEAIAALIGARRKGEVIKELTNTAGTGISGYRTFTDDDRRRAHIVANEILCDLIKVLP